MSKRSRSEFEYQEIKDYKEQKDGKEGKDKKDQKDSDNYPLLLKQKKQKTIELSSTNASERHKKYTTPWVQLPSSTLTKLCSYRNGIDEHAEFAKIHPTFRYEAKKSSSWNGDFYVNVVRMVNKKNKYLFRVYEGDGVNIELTIENIIRMKHLLKGVMVNTLFISINEDVTLSIGLSSIFDLCRFTHLKSMDVPLSAMGFNLLFSDLIGKLTGPMMTTDELSNLSTLSNLSLEEKTLKKPKEKELSTLQEYRQLDFHFTSDKPNSVQDKIILYNLISPSLTTLKIDQDDTQINLEKKRNGDFSPNINRPELKEWNLIGINTNNNAVVDVGDVTEKDKAAEKDEKDKDEKKKDEKNEKTFIQLLPKQLPRLQVLELNNMIFDKDNKENLFSLGSCVKLSKLELTNCSIEDPTIFKNMGEIEVCRVSHTTRDNIHMEEIPILIENCVASKIEIKIEKPHQALDDRFATALRFNATIFELMLNVDLPPDMRALKTMLNLNFLAVRTNSVVQRIAFPDTIEILQWSGKSPMSEQVVFALSNCPKLIELTLFNIKIPQDSKEFPKQKYLFFKTFEKLVALLHFNVRIFSPVDEPVELAEYVTKEGGVTLSSTLESLEIGNNDSEIFFEIAMFNNCPIKTLTLKNVDIGNFLVNSDIDVDQGLHQIETLTIYWPTFEHELNQENIDAFNWNLTLKKLTIHYKVGSEVEIGHFLVGINGGSIEELTLLDKSIERKTNDLNSGLAERIYNDLKDWKSLKRFKWVIVMDRKASKAFTRKNPGKKRSKYFDLYFSLDKNGLSGKLLFNTNTLINPLRFPHLEKNQIKLSSKPDKVSQLLS